jgi:class 3 adenylate cyclase
MRFETAIVRAASSMASKSKAAASDAQTRDSFAVRPQTRYAKSGGVNIAYQVVGDGPTDLVYVPGWVSHVELSWELPDLAHCFDRLASFSRLILFDKRGTGMSDPVPERELPTLEQRMDDVRAVMDAVGSERATVFGSSEGGNMSVLFAATYPERTNALCTFGSFAKRVWSSDYPWAPTPEERQRTYEYVEQNWSGGMDVADIAPSLDPGARERVASYFRRCASPGAALALLKMNTAIDVRDVLHAIQVPALVMHRTHDQDTDVAEGRFLAEHIPGARFVELAGEDHLWWTQDPDPIVDEVEELVTGARPLPEPDRVLATVLFTDIVGSTERLRELGDRGFAELVARHDVAVRRELERFRGREVDTAGDGFFATFDGPARAIRCAVATRDSVRELGLELRAGLHTGECELHGDKVRGIAVHTGARLAALAGAGEVLVSSTVHDLVSGSGIAFEERGEHELRGVGTRRVFAVTRA